MSFLRFQQLIFCVYNSQTTFAQEDGIQVNYYKNVISNHRIFQKDIMLVKLRQTAICKDYPGTREVLSEVLSVKLPVHMKNT